VSTHPSCPLVSCRRVSCVVSDGDDGVHREGTFICFMAATCCGRSCSSRTPWTTPTRRGCPSPITTASGPPPPLLVPRSSSPTLNCPILYADRVVCVSCVVCEPSIGAEQRRCQGTSRLTYRRSSASLSPKSRSQCTTRTHTHTHTHTHTQHSAVLTRSVCVCRYPHPFYEQLANLEYLPSQLGSCIEQPFQPLENVPLTFVRVSFSGCGGMPRRASL